MSGPLTILPLLPNDDTSPILHQQVVASPISDVPTDILLTIFETLVLAWDATPMIPILLARVCTRWRECVVNCPTLWSTIRTLEVLDLTTIFFAHEIKRIKTFLRRSRNCPLTVSIAIYSAHHEGEDNVYTDNLPDFHHKLRELSQALGQNAHRIKSFTLVIDEYQSNTIVLSGLKDVTMPMLTHWEVRNVYDESWSLVDQYLDNQEVNAHSVLLHPKETSDDRCMSLYPNLQSVSLHAIPHHWSRFSPSNLVTLEIKMIPEVWRPSASALARILRTNAHSLEKLILLVALPPTTYPGEVIVLPNLGCIELGFTHTSEIIPFINAIDVPNLRVLGLCDSRREYLHPTDLLDDPAFDVGIIDLFSVIVDRFPLRQLTDLSLRHIALCPMPRPSSEILSNRMGIAIDFFCRLENVNYLTISNSDVVTLHALNSVQVREKPQRDKFPVPKLSFLQIMDTGYHILKGFIWHRLNGPKVQRTLDTLVLHMPNSWYQVLKWDTLKLEKLAQEVFPFVSQLGDDAEQQLAAM